MHLYSPHKPSKEPAGWRLTTNSGQLQSRVAADLKLQGFNRGLRQKHGMEINEQFWNAPKSSKSSASRFVGLLVPGLRLVWHSRSSQRRAFTDVSSECVKVDLFQRYNLTEASTLPEESTLTAGYHRPLLFLRQRYRQEFVSSSMQLWRLYRVCLADKGIFRAVQTHERIIQGRERKSCLLASFCKSARKILDLCNKCRYPTNIKPEKVRGWQQGVFVGCHTRHFKSPPRSIF